MAEPATARELPVRADDGHRWRLLAIVPADAHSRLLWLPALGVAARHYLPFAQALARRGVAVYLHEWRGNGSSNLRPARGHDWGYRELLQFDLPASEAAIAGEDGGATPRILGGHSLGGQLACCHAAIHPDRAMQLWLVASGSPYWRAFPARTGAWLPLAYHFLPWLARRCGYLPGRRIGFGGNEARSVIADWARSALSGRYAATGLDVDLEAALSRLETPARAVLLAGDWLAPAGSTRYLLSKLPLARQDITTLDAVELGVRAGHFDWMRAPAGVVDALVRAD